MTSFLKTLLAMCTCVLLFQGAVLTAQTPLTNDAIVKMVKAGLADDVIVSMINSQAAQFSVTPDAMIALKKDGVSDKVVAAMVTKGAATTAPVAAPAADNTANLEVGVYVKRKGEWV